MGEFTLILVGLIVLCLLVSLVYAKQPTTSQLFAPQTTDYAVTIWANQANPHSYEPPNLPQPQKITVQYTNQLKADSAEALAHAKHVFAQQCNADFQRRFIPMLGAYKIGAVHCQPAHEIE